MKILFFFTIIFSVTIILSSCSSLYMPNVPATPMFTDKGQAFASGHISFKGNMSGSIGATLGNHIALVGSGSYIERRQNDGFRQHLIEGALGYFTKIGPQKRQVLEVYGGYGYGNSLADKSRASTTGLVTVESKDMSFEKQFLQVNYSSKKEGSVNVFGSERELSYGTVLRFSRVSSDGFFIDEKGVPQEENFFIEPVFFTKLSLNNHFQLQYTNGFNIALLKRDNLKAGNSVFTLGLIYNFGRL